MCLLYIHFKVTNNHTHLDLYCFGTEFDETFSLINLSGFRSGSESHMNEALEIFSDILLEKW